MKTVVLTIDENGDQTFLKTDSAACFVDENTTTRRASHVEPADALLRWAFHLLRTLFGDKGRVSDWTRGWNTLWRVNTAPVGGPILRWGHVWEKWPVLGPIALYSNRQDAIDAEVEFLNRWFAERTQ